MVRFGLVPTFLDAKADIAQAEKVIEEAREAEQAVIELTIARNSTALSGVADAERLEALEAAVIEECCDVVQAVANLLSGLGVCDAREAMDAVRGKNESRGRRYAAVEDES